MSELIASLDDGRLTLRLNRPEAGNSLTKALLEELLQAFGRAESEPACRVVVIEGQGGSFCSGMDFEEAAAAWEGGKPAFDPRRYMDVLKRAALLPKPVIAKVDGKALAGGLGLVAASDLAVATPKSEFALPEALWGLLPACVVPYLIRRVGPQSAYRLTLTTGPIDAAEAARIGLVDAVSSDPDAAIERWSRRLKLLAPETVRELKRYFRRMWIVDDEKEKEAVDELRKLLADPKVRENVLNFVRRQKLPWD
jgi:3-carboxymethyl-3-hydroxy-acyl-[acp] dehydratase